MRQLPLMLPLMLMLLLRSSGIATTTDTGTKAGTGYSAQLRVLSNDGTVSISVDGSSGLITSIVTRGVKHRVSAGSAMEGLITLQVVVRKLASSVVVERTVCIKASDVPCTMTQALLTETFEPRLSSVGWVLNASSPSTPSVPVPLWTRALQTNVTFADAADKKLWLPWERSGNPQCCTGSKFVNALLPSDGGYSWWSENFMLGALAVPGDHDYIIHDMATVLHPSRDVGVSFISSPANPPVHPTFLNTSGPARNGTGGASCPNVGDCLGPASFSVSRHHLRFGDGAAPHVFDTDIVAHAADWRDALAFTVDKHATFWEPQSPRIKEIEGLGSYGSYLGNLTDPMFEAMGFALNWDLSGRFFPYAGQFLPPVAVGELWLNDGEGSQPRANCSFKLIDAYYHQMQREGWAGLSYFNIFEYGENLCGIGVKDHPLPPPCNFSGVPAGGAVPSSAKSWANSTEFLLQNFPEAVITDYDCGGSQWCKNPRIAGERQPIGTWQGGLVVDPLDALYNHHLMAQLKRKYDHISHFEGMVVDRADWNVLYNFDGDDGASFIGNRTARSMQRSYLDTTKQLREMMNTRSPAMAINSTVMLTNNQGFAKLGLMEQMDGSFSEGGALNSHGLLGMRSTSILWTYSKTECCASAEVADVFFQRQLYMKVFPMAPLPQADHAISASDPAVVALYSRYGQMFTALKGATWLLRPHALNVTGGDAVANVFEQLHAPGLATLWVVVLGGSQATAKLSVAYLPAETGSDAFEVLHPRDIALPHQPIPAAMVSCASSTPLLFIPSVTKPTTIATKNSSCLTASAPTPGASLSWKACDGSATQQYVFTNDGHSYGGDCVDTSCRNIQLANNGQGSRVATPLCVEFHNSVVPCPNGGEVCLWTCNGGWLQNISWSNDSTGAGGSIELAPGSHHNHTATSMDCLGHHSTAATGEEQLKASSTRERWSALPRSKVELRGNATAVLGIPLRRGCAMVRAKVSP